MFCFPPLFLPTVQCHEPNIFVHKPRKSYTYADVTPKGKARHKPPPYRPDTEYWDEFLLYNPQQGYAWLIREENHYSLEKVTKLRPEKDPSRGAQKNFVQIGQNQYQIYDHGIAVLDEAEGETPWIAKPGDKVTSADLIAPPNNFSVEQSGNEIEYFSGVYIEPEEVWKGFALQGSPPERHTVGGCQPFNDTPTWRQSKLWALGFAAATFLMLGMILIFGNGTKLMSTRFGSQRMASVLTTPTFKIARANTVCRLAVNAEITNQWVWLGFDVIDEAGRPVGEFSTQLSYYYGSGWTEGSHKGTVLFRIKDPGTYRLRMSQQSGTGESEDGSSVPVHLELYGGYWPRRYFLGLLIFTGLVALLLFDKKWRFERARWSEVIEEEDDDD